MRIDVHAHYYPAALYELLERLTGQPQRRPGPAVPGFCPPRVRSKASWS